MFEKKQYIYKVKPNNTDIENSASEDEINRIGEHFSYLKKAKEDGKIILAGRCTDASFGIVIFYADSDKEALEFMNNDPAVANDIFSAEMRGFSVVL